MWYNEGMFELAPRLRTFVAAAETGSFAQAAERVFAPRDLYGETLLIVKRGYLREMDALRDDLEAHHPRIRLEDFAFHSTEVFNQCENGGKLLVAIKEWQDVHPLMRVLPVRWGHTIPFGLLHSPTPSPRV